MRKSEDRIGRYEERGKARRQRKGSAQQNVGGGGGGWMGGTAIGDELQPSLQDVGVLLLFFCDIFWTIFNNY